MPNPRVVIKAKTSLLKRILSPDRLEEELRVTQRELAADAEIVFASFALHRTGRMARNIHTVVAGKDLLVETEARDPISGFDYVRITRFGHRTYRIVPKRPFAATIVATHGKRSKGRTAALRWVQTDNTVIYRHSTKGFHPTRDWASEAIPQIRVVAERRMRGLARRIELAWSA
jgi:hypothetical protein